MKGKLLKKLCAVSLAVAMLAGAGVGMANTGLLPETSVTVSAYESGKYYYDVNNDGTITLTGVILLTENIQPKSNLILSY